MAGILHGKEALAMARKSLGRELTPQEKQIVSSEGYSKDNYRDTKNVLTSGFGQTGEFMGMPLDEVAKLFEARTAKLIPSYNKLSEPLRLKLLDSTYRGGISGSPKALELANKGQWKQAAAEFLDNDEYKAAVKSGSGVAKRMEETAQAMINEDNKDSKQVVPKMSNKASSFFQDIQDMGESFWDDIWGEDGDIVVENAKRAKQYKYIQGEYDPSKPANHSNPNESNYIPSDSTAQPQFEDPWLPNYVEDEGLETFSVIPFLKGLKYVKPGMAVGKQLLNRSQTGVPSAPPTPQQMLNASRQAGGRQVNSSQTNPVPPMATNPSSSVVKPTTQPVVLNPNTMPAVVKPNNTMPAVVKPNNTMPAPFTNPTRTYNGFGNPGIKGPNSIPGIKGPPIKDVFNNRPPAVYKPQPVRTPIQTPKPINPNMLRVASAEAASAQPVTNAPVVAPLAANATNQPFSEDPNTMGLAPVATAPQRPGYKVVRSGNGEPVKAGGGGYVWSKDYQHPMWNN